jgi:ribokinase
LDNVVTADRRLLPQTAGGNVVYSALGARLWHDRVGLVSRAGRNFSPAFLDCLAAKGLDLAGIQQMPQLHGMNVAFCYSPDGSRVRQFPPDVVQMLPAEERARFTDYTTFGREHRYSVWMAFAPDGTEVPDAWYDEIAAVHCAAMPVERHLAIAATLRNSVARAAWLQVDSPWYDERKLERDYASQLLSDIDALLPSEDDIVKVTGPDGVIAEVHRLFERGATTIVLKRGDAGVDIFRQRHGRAVRVRALPCEVVDLTGAGDAFCGGFLAGMHLTGDVERAAAFGTVSASFAVEGIGIARLIVATRDEAWDRLEHLESLRARVPGD